MPRVSGAKMQAKSGKTVLSVTQPETAETEKKKRNNNPGVRQQGGRIYDSENGTTCHQCRQKTIETKAKCRAAKCTLYFCPRCLENRYNEDVEVVNKRANWSCPRCRSLCNCSNCRKKQGLEATGILAKVAKTAGFGSVSDLLQKNPKAQSFSMGHKISSEDLVEGSSGGQGNKAANNTAPSLRPAAPKKRKAADDQLLDDASLGRRPAPLPLGAPIVVHKFFTSTGGGGSAGTAGGSAKRQRGPAWLEKVPDTSKLPADVDAGEFACILEFIAVFGASPLGMRAPSLPALAAELIQPAALKPAAQLCPIPEDSAVGALHVKLLETVRNAWGVRGSVGVSAWQGMMCAYYAATQVAPDAAAAMRIEHGPPAVAGEVFIHPPRTDDDEEEVDIDGGGVLVDAQEGSGDEGGCSHSQQQACRGAAALLAPQTDFPEGGYWGLAPGTRVAMLSMLIHDALDTYTLRDAIEASMGDAVEGEKERRSELADVRRAAKEAAAKQRDQEIALIIAGGATKSMTLEEQRRVMEEARHKAESTALAAAAAKVTSLSRTVHAPMVRVAPLGSDRDGRLVYNLQSATILTGHSNGLVMCTYSGDIEVHTDAVGVAAALDPRGRREGPLRHAVMTVCKVTEASLHRSPGRASGSSNVKKGANGGGGGGASGSGAKGSAAGAGGKGSSGKQRGGKVNNKVVQMTPLMMGAHEMHPASPPPSKRRASQVNSSLPKKGAKGAAGGGGKSKLQRGIVA